MDAEFELGLWSKEGLNGGVVTIEGGLASLVADATGETVRVWQNGAVGLVGDEVLWLEVWWSCSGGSVQALVKRGAAAAVSVSMGAGGVLEWVLGGGWSLVSHTQEGSMYRTVVSGKIGEAVSPSGWSVSLEGAHNCVASVDRCEVWVGSYGPDKYVSVDPDLGPEPRTFGAKFDAEVRVRGYDRLTLVVNGTVLRYEEVLVPGEETVISVGRDSFGWRWYNAGTVMVRDANTQAWEEYEWRWWYEPVAADVSVYSPSGTVYSRDVEVVGTWRGLGSGIPGYSLDGGPWQQMEVGESGEFVLRLYGMSEGAHEITWGWRDEVGALHEVGKTQFSVAVGGGPLPGVPGGSERYPNLLPGEGVRDLAAWLTTAQSFVSMLWGIFPGEVQSLVVLGVGGLIVMRVLGR